MAKRQSIPKGKRVNISAQDLKDMDNFILTSSGEIQQWMAEYMKLSEADIDQLCRGEILEIYNEVAQATPRDTGRAAAGWLINSYPTGSEPPPGQYDLGAVMADRENALNNIGILGPYSVENNVEYIMPLEYGSSNQAPGGFFRVALQNSLASIKKAVADFNKRKTR